MNYAGYKVNSFYIDPDGIRFSVDNGRDYLTIFAKEIKTIGTTCKKVSFGLYDLFRGACLYLRFKNLIDESNNSKAEAVQDALMTCIIVRKNIEGKSIKDVCKALYKIRTEIAQVTDTANKAEEGRELIRYCKNELGL